MGLSSCFGVARTRKACCDPLVSIASLVIQSYPSAGLERELVCEGEEVEGSSGSPRPMETYRLLELVTRPGGGVESRAATKRFGSSSGMPGCRADRRMVEWKRLRMEECIVEALVGSGSGIWCIAVESGERRRDVSAEFAERRVVEVRRWCGRWCGS